MHNFSRYIQALVTFPNLYSFGRQARWQGRVNGSIMIIVKGVFVVPINQEIEYVGQM